MLSIHEMLQKYNTTAATQNLPQRKSFRDRKTAIKVLESLGINLNGEAETEANSAQEAAPAPQKAQPEKKKTATTTKAKKKVKAKSAAKKKKTPATSKQKKQSAVVQEDEEKDLAVFQVLRGSQQHKVLRMLLDAKGKLVSNAALAKTASVSISRLICVLRDIERKTKGEALRGKTTRPKYQLKREKIEKEQHVALQAE